MNLRPYQAKYIDRVREAYRQGYRAPCVIAPCGAGKSIIIGTIAKESAKKNNKVLFLVHRRELCDQIRRTFDLLEVPESCYHITMVQTVSKKLEQMEKPGLIITDENHHGLAATYRKIYDYFADVPRLGFTATPIRLNGSGLGDVNDLLIEEVTVSWLIANNYLAPFKYYAPKLINEDHLKLNRLKDFSNTSVDAAMKENRTIFGDAVKHYKQLANGEKAIAYCHSVEASLDLAREFRDQEIRAEHIDAKTPKQERARIIEAFRSGLVQVLTNVDLIGEGFDVPDCSTVILLRPTQSLSLYIQQSMRGMRYQPGKRSIIIDHVGNVHRFGLPDQERSWSLETVATKKNEVSIRTCRRCFSVFETNFSRCPFCGYVEIAAERTRELEIDPDFELEEFKPTIVIDYREPSDCKNMKELYELAENKNYKRGWAWHQGKRLGLI